MDVFTLPDRVKDLVAVEQQLKDELSVREAEFALVHRNYPPNLNSKKTPAFYSVMVAHRRWQHAYEKLMRARRHETST